MNNNYNINNPPISIIKQIKSVTDKLYNIDDYFNQYAINKLMAYQNKLQGCAPCRVAAGISESVEENTTPSISLLSSDDISFSLFANLNASFFVLTVFMVLIALIAFFIPKTPKGISILNVLSAFIMLMFLITLPIPDQYSTFAPITGLEYTPFVYLFAIFSGIHLISFLAVNNTVTFTRDNNQIEYPLLMVLLFFTSFILIAATNWLIILISLEAITFIVAVLVAFQRNHSLTPSVAIRYILFSAIPSGILILGISEFYVYFGTFNLFDLEQLQLVYNIDESTVPVQEIKNNMTYLLYEDIFNYTVWGDPEHLYYEIMGHNSKANALTKLEEGAEFLRFNEELAKTRPFLHLFVKFYTHWHLFTAHVSVYNVDTEKYVFGPHTEVVDKNFLLNDLKDFGMLKPPESRFDYYALDYYNRNMYDNECTLKLESTSLDISNNLKTVYYKGDNSVPISVEDKILRERNAIDLYAHERGYDSKVGIRYALQLLKVRYACQVFDTLFPTFAVYQNKIGVPANYTMDNDACNVLSNWRLMYLFDGKLKTFDFDKLGLMEYVKLDDDITLLGKNYFISNGDKSFFNETSLVSLNHNYETPIIITVALFMVMFNILFKLTAAPFHFWAPIVYEGAPLPITMFLSIFTKIVMVFLLIKVIIYSIPLYDTSWVNLLLFSGVFSIVVGIFGAISETRIKRFFVYSSMGHVGFMLLGLVEGGVHGITASLMYLIIYIFSAFILWLILLTATKPINYLTQLSGLSNSNPALSLILSLTLLSMSGIPPLAGFYVKFDILYVLASSGYYGIAFITLLLTIISFFYYLRIIKILYFEPTKLYKRQFNFNRMQATILVSFFFLVVGYSFYVQGSSYFYLKSIVQTLF